MEIGTARRRAMPVTRTVPTIIGYKPNRPNWGLQVDENRISPRE
jgi:hypothetical protein